MANWGEYARIIDEVRPGIILIENVAALVRRGLDRVLSDLNALGFDAEWGVFEASQAGAPHRRQRLFVVAHTQCGYVWIQSGRIRGEGGKEEIQPELDREALANTDGERERESDNPTVRDERPRKDVGRGYSTLAYPNSRRRELVRFPGISDQRQAQPGHDTHGCYVPFPPTRYDADGARLPRRLSGS